jgi:protease-4
MESMIHYSLKQIEMVAKDEHVQAVILRIDSPGGTISASEDVFKHLKRLRDGKVRKYPDSKAKKIVVSMGAVAASGGYYVSMTGERIYAEKGTLTGSIGVYASLPNVADFVHEHGIKFELIKAGGIKAGGSPFHELTQQERQPWQDMVDAAYDQFLDVVVEGRPKLAKEAMKSTPLFQKEVPIRDEKGNVVKDWWGRPRTTQITRYLADGGSFTSAEAKQYGLVDEIGDLEDAVDGLANLTGLTRYSVVEYERPANFWTSLVGARQAAVPSVFDPQQFSNGLVPRVWYLSTQADLAGIFAGMNK